VANLQLKEHERFHNHKLRHDLVELIGPTNTLVVLRDVETDLVEGTVKGANSRVAPHAASR
jgi:hypothetical protein